MSSKLEQLKLEADALNVPYSNNIGQVALAAKIEEFKASNNLLPKAEEVVESPEPEEAGLDGEVESRTAKLARLKKEATKLIRCTITAMNPAHRGLCSGCVFL